jgi:hypothetical protein
MKTTIVIKLALFSGILSSIAADSALPNTLTDAEKAAGWRLLWDGETSDGWRTPRSERFPARGWGITNGILTVAPSGGAESRGGDIISKERFSRFELMVDFQITEAANSGVKYLVQPNLAAIGPEFQILDDLRHPDARAGRDGNRTLGSLYDILPALTTKKVNPVGEWNTARIVVMGKRVEHWLNGEKILEYERDSEAFRQAVAQSKFKNTPDFGEWADGHILLQDHGDRVSYRNIKIRRLPIDPHSAHSSLP